MDAGYLRATDGVNKLTRGLSERDDFAFFLIGTPIRDREVGGPEDLREIVARGGLG